MLRALSLLVAVLATLAPSLGASAAPRLSSPIPAELTSPSSTWSATDARIARGPAIVEALRGPIASESGIAPGLPVFLQRDPSGFVDSVNVYAAMANDPINNRDPTGRDSGSLPTIVTTTGLLIEYGYPIITTGAGIASGMQAAAMVPLALALASVAGPGLLLQPERKINFTVNMGRPSADPSSTTPKFAYDPATYERLRQMYPNAPVYYAGSEEEAEGHTILLRANQDASARVAKTPPTQQPPVQALGDFNGPWRADNPTQDWGRYLEKQGVEAPLAMYRPHAHHILFRKGLGPTQQAMVEEGQRILRNAAGLDPIWAPENLVWAPNGRGTHSTERLAEVVAKLKGIQAANGKPQDYIAALRALGVEAAGR